MPFPPSLHKTSHPEILLPRYSFFLRRANVTIFPIKFSADSSQYHSRIEIKYLPPIGTNFAISPPCFWLQSWRRALPPDIVKLSGKYEQFDWIMDTAHAQTRRFATSSHAHFQEHDLRSRALSSIIYLEIGLSPKKCGKKHGGFPFLRSL